MSSFLKSEYYDCPDGKDMGGKLIATNKYAVGFGLAYSTFDVLLYSKTQGYLPTVARFASNIGPLMGMATAFTLTTYVATNLRGKDDRLNYFLGGMAAGAVFGSWRGSVPAGGVMGLFFGVAAVIKKTSKIEGWDFFPKARYQEFSTINPHDWTIMAERPKNYTTNKETNQE